MAVAPKLPIPPGMTQDQLEEIPIEDPRWRMDLDHACKACHSPAYRHPYTDMIWACKICPLWTYAIAVHFYEMKAVPRPVLDEPAPVVA